MIDNGLRFRLITIASDEELFHVVERGMRDAATALNVDADLVGTPGFDIEDAIRMVRSAVHDGIDGIGLNVFHPTALAGVIAEAGAAGVPVVAFNIDAAKTGSGNLSYIMQDFFAAGTVLGHRAAASVADGEHIIVAMHDDGVGALEERAAGIEAGLAFEAPLSHVSSPGARQRGAPRFSMKHYSVWAPAQSLAPDSRTPRPQG